MKRLVWMSGLLGAILISGCFTHRQLVNPEVNIPANLSTADIQQSIHKAFDSYRWTVDKEDPGATTAHLQQDKFFASVRVVYDQHRATIEYLESKNFWHEKSSTGEERIHSRYIVWVNNIADSLRRKLNSISH